MPAAIAIPLISSAIGAGSSLAGGMIGSKASKSAAQTQVDNANRVAGMASQSANDAYRMASEAAGSAGTGVSNAAGAAGTAVSNAAGQAVAGVNAGTGQANNTLASVLAGEYGNFDTEYQNLLPYLNLGKQGATSLSEAMNPGGSLTQQFAFDPTQIANDPSYQFRQQQGAQAVQRAMAAQGQNLSGGTLKSLTQYSQGLASEETNNAYARALNTFSTNRNNTLQGIMAMLGVGQTGTGQLQSATSELNSGLRNFGNQVSNNTLQNALYGGNTGINAATYGGNLGYNAAQYAGNTGLQAAMYGGDAAMRASEIAGNALTGGAAAKAAGTVGAASSWNNALGGVANAVNGGLSMYNFSNNPWGTAATNPANYTPTLNDLTGQGLSTNAS